MANRYANLPGAAKIKDTYDRINQGFDLVEQDVDQLRADLDQEIVDREAAVEYVDQRVDNIIVGGGPDKDPELVDIRNLDPSYTPQRTINAAGDVTRDMQAQFVEYKNEVAKYVVNVEKYGIVGDGVTDDTDGFEQLESDLQGKIVDLLGKTYLVTKQFAKNHYINGRFNINGNVFDVASSIPVANNSNVFIGERAGEKTNKYPVYESSEGDYSNIGIGKDALKENAGGWRNVAIGDGAMESNTLGHYNVAVGDYALQHNIGTKEGSSDDKGSRNTAIGSKALQFNTDGHHNTAVGRNALHTNLDGHHNTAVGSNALGGNAPYINGVVVPEDPKSGNYNTAVGSSALLRTNSNHNTAVGNSAAMHTKNGVSNVAIGSEALMYNEMDVPVEDKTTRGSSNTAIGTTALKYMQDGSPATLLNNCIGIGNGSRVSGNNQAQIGGTGVTTYTYGAVQDRSDIRDKADVRDTVFGLWFIEKLRPVDFKWDYRDDYVVIDEETGEVTIKEKDGSKKRNRYHHGLIAQDVQKIIEDTGIDFGGFQDHKVNGGKDVLTLGYTEFIAPMIKAIQELSEKVKDLEKIVNDR